MLEAEQKFMAENGMSSKKALEYVFQWQSEGKYEQAQKGCEEILKFFPDNHEVQMLLNKIQDKLGAEAIPDEENQETPASLQKRKGVLDKAEGILNVISPLKKSSSSQNSLPGIEQPKDKERILAALSYVWFIALLAIFLKRDSAFVQHHAWQSIVLFLFISLAKPFVFTPLVGTFGFLAFGVQMITIVLLAGAAFLAYNGKWFKIPFLYSFSQTVRNLF